MKGISFPRKYIVPLFILLGANLVSLTNAEYPLEGMIKIGKLVVAFAFIFGIVYHATKNKQVLKRISWAIPVGGLIAAFYGIGQYYLGGGAPDLAQGPRVFGAVGSVYGAFIGAAIAGTFSILLTDDNLKRRMLLLPALIPLTYALYISRTRAWVLGTILALLAILLLRLYKRMGAKKLTVVCLSLLLLVLLLLGVAQSLLVKTFAFLFVRTEMVPARVAGKGVNLPPDLSMMFRYRIWGFAWKVFLTHPLTGVGVGNMRIENPAKPTMVEPRQGIGYTDNHYLNVLAETGILGGVAWIYLLSLLFSASWRVVQGCQDSRLQGMCFGFIGGMIVFLTGGVFWLLTALVYDSAMLAFLFALVFSSERLVHQE